MSKMTFEYTENRPVLEVDGVDYPLPRRTPIIENALLEHDEKLGTVSEYESNMDLLGILFGEDSAKEMFPDGINTDLDKLAKCAKYALAAYRATLTSIRDEIPDDTKQKLSEAKEMIDLYKETKKLSARNYAARKKK